MSYTLTKTPAGTTYIETTCVGSCEKPYRIDEHHPSYAAVKALLDHGDRSGISCYHKARHS